MCVSAAGLHRVCVLSFKPTSALLSSRPATPSPKQADICQLGMDQRKVNMLAREYCDDCRPKRLKPVILSHAMLPGLLEVRRQRTAGPDFGRCRGAALPRQDRDAVTWLGDLRCALYCNLCLDSARLPFKPPCPDTAPLLYRCPHPGRAKRR